MKTVNAQLDAEREVWANNRADRRKLKNLKREKSELVIVTSASINGGHKRHKPPPDIQLPKIKPEETLHMKLQLEIVRFFSILGVLFGSIISFAWVPKRHIMFWHTNILLSFSCFTILNTQFLHYRNGDYLKILEACAIYGIATSVISNL